MKVKIKNNYQQFLIYFTGFLFVTTSVLSVMKVGGLLAYEQVPLETANIPNSQDVINLPNFEGPDLPVKKPDAIYPEFSAFSIFAIDVESGTVLFEKNPDIQILPASTTKIMTALVAMEAYDVDQIMVVPKIRVAGQKMNLINGEMISVRDLLYGLLVASANDAAEVLAYYYPLNSRQGFIQRMNEKAKEIGMENTFFTNPTGLEDIGHLSTARDMVALSIYAMQNPFFASIVGTKQITLKSFDGAYKHNLLSINQLLGEVEGVLGVKTGWTENAKENLVSYVQRNGRTIAIALLGSDDRFGESKKLIEWLYENYSWQKVYEP